MGYGGGVEMISLSFYITGPNTEQFELRVGLQHIQTVARFRSIPAL